jgi:C-terminal processing protease CtpA/Prc
MRRSLTLWSTLLAFAVLLSSTAVMAQNNSNANQDWQENVNQLEEEMKELEKEMKALEKEMKKMDFNVARDFEFEFDFDFSNIKSCDQKAQIKPSRSFLGIYLDDHPSKEGILVEGTVEQSGARAAGLKKGDVIKSIDGSAMKQSDDLGPVLAQYSPGDLITIRFERDGQMMQTAATLTKKRSSWERDPCKVFIGVTLSGHGPEGKGSRITGIIDDTPADEAKLQKGDVIMALDGQATNNFDEVLVERNKHEAGDWFTLTIYRDGTTQDVKARFKSCDEVKPEILYTEPIPVNESPSATEEPAERVDEPAEEEDDEPAPRTPGPLQLENWSVFPNPNYGKFHLQFEGNSAPTTIQILNTNGKKVFEENLNNFDGTFNRKIDLRTGPGTLFIQVRQGDKVYSDKIVVLSQA